MQFSRNDNNYMISKLGAVDYTEYFCLYNKKYLLDESLIENIVFQVISFIFLILQSIYPALEMAN